MIALSMRAKFNKHAVTHSETITFAQRRWVTECIFSAVWYLSPSPICPPPPPAPVIVPSLFTVVTCNTVERNSYIFIEALYFIYVQQQCPCPRTSDNDP